MPQEPHSDAFGRIPPPPPPTEEHPSLPQTADATLYDLLMTLHEMTYLKPERPRADVLIRRLSRAYQNLLAFRRPDGGFTVYRCVLEGVRDSHVLLGFICFLECMAIEHGWV